MPFKVSALVDDPGIPGSELVYRRVAWLSFGGRERYEPGATPKINANCLADYGLERANALGYPAPCMSVDLGRVLAAEKRVPEDLVSGTEYGLIMLTVQDLRGLLDKEGKPRPQGIMAAPEPNHPWHAVVWDLESVTTLSRAPKKHRTLLAERAEWVVPLVA